MTRTVVTLIGLAAFLAVAATAGAQTTPPAKKQGSNVTVYGPQTTTPPAPGTNTTAAGFVDANGDGICDWYQGGGRGQGPGVGRGGRGGYGPGAGPANQGGGPRDGTGYRGGRGTQRGPGSPECDGTGPKGPRGRR